MGIEIKNVSYAVDETKILKDVSLAIGGGMFGLIGPNGAGKTTLLRVISGYIKPDEGSVLLDGVQIEKISINERAKKMALVPQNYALDYDFTVLETVLMGRNPHKKLFETDTAQDIELARENIRKAGIEELENRSIIGLSGGEWQRMIIARALTQQSKVLLLDEPVSNLDIKHQVGILDTVRYLVEESGLICICVLHDLNLTHYYCDHIALMKHGRIAGTGPAEEVLRKDALERVYDTRIDIFEDKGRTYIFPVMGERC